MGQSSSALAGTKRPLFNPAFPSAKRQKTDNPSTNNGESNITNSCTGKDTTTKKLPQQPRTPLQQQQHQQVRLPKIRNREIHATLVEQLSFYFSAANLQKDRFLVDTMYTDPAGWIDISIFMGFNRIKQLGATLKDVVVALRAIKTVEVEELGKLEDEQLYRVRVRGGLPSVKKLLDDEVVRNVDQRTVYAEPFRGNISHEEVRKKFSEYGSVVYVSIPRFAGGKAKGFAFVEFFDEASAKRCVECSGRENGSLRVITKEAWLVKKKEHKEWLKKRVSRAKEMAKLNGRGNTNSEKNLHATPTAANASHGAEPLTTKSTKYTPGLIVDIAGLSKGKGVTRKALHEELEEFGPIAFVEFKTKIPDRCRVRYLKPESAAEALNSLQARENRLLGATVDVKILKGREEEECWELITIKMKEQGRKRSKKKERRQKLREMQLTNNDSPKQRPQPVARCSGAVVPSTRSGEAVPPSRTQVSHNRQNKKPSHVVFNDLDET